MHSMCLRKMFVFELFIITDETNLYTSCLPLKAVLTIKLLLIKLTKLKVIVDNHEMHR